MEQRPVHLLSSPPTRQAGAGYVGGLDARLHNSRFRPAVKPILPFDPRPQLPVARRISAHPVKLALTEPGLRQRLEIRSSGGANTTAGSAARAGAIGPTSWNVAKDQFRLPAS